jgi:hypothetical protein
MLLAPDDPRLAFYAPQPVTRQPAAVRLERFPRAAQAVLGQQMGPLANLRSSSGCAAVVATDSPWVRVHLERLRHHQPIPQSLAVEVDLAWDHRHGAPPAATAGQPGRDSGQAGRFRVVDSTDLRECEGDLAVDIPTGLERGGAVRPVWIWMPLVSTCALRAVELADGAAAETVLLPTPRWLAIGDSTGQGFICQSPTASLVHRLSRRWDVPAWNLGVGGMLIEPDVVAWALTAHPWDLITIGLGSNHGWSDATMADAGDRAERLATLACATSAARVVWILPPWKPCEDGKGPPDFAGVALDRATGRRMEALRETLRQRLEPFAPRLELVGDLCPHDHRLLPDGLHPQAWGFAQIAERLHRAVQR